MIDPDAILSEVTGQTPHQDPDKDRDPYSHESDGQRDPSPLEHPGEYIPAQVIGAEEIDPEWREIFGTNKFSVRSGEGGEESFRETDKGRIEDRSGPRREKQTPKGDEKKEDEDSEPCEGERIFLEEPPEFLHS